MFNDVNSSNVRRSCPPAITSTRLNMKTAFSVHRRSVSVSSSFGAFRLRLTLFAVILVSWTANCMATFFAEGLILIGPLADQIFQAQQTEGRPVPTAANVVKLGQQLG